MESSVEALDLIVDVFNPSGNTCNVKSFPTVETLASLSHTVYYQKFASKIIYNISESRENNIKINSLPESWKLLGTAEYKVRNGGDGYHGAAYFNVSTKQIVIAHRGTELTNLGSLWTDTKGVIFNGYTSQMKSAYLFTKLIVEEFWQCCISISLTGHSLGGWLSQTSAFFMKYPNFAERFARDERHKLNVNMIAPTLGKSVRKESHHLHVIVFDSPGVLNIVECYLQKHIPRYLDDRLFIAKYLDALDITTYFSSPNAINSCNLHVGALFMMSNISDKKGSLSKVKDIIEFFRYTFDSHNMKKIVNFWQSAAFDQNSVSKVTDWPVGFTETNMYHKNLQGHVNEFTKIKFKTDPVDINLLRMSVFDREEREFLEDIQYLKSFGVDGENSTWEIVFQDKDLTQANYVLNRRMDSTQRTKNSFEFFDSFRILIDSQVLKVDNQFGIDFFVFFVKRLTCEVFLPKLVKEVISELPKVYQAIYQGFSTEFLNRIPKIRVNDFTGLQDFIESGRYRIYQAVARQSTFICVAKIIKVLKSKVYSFGGNENINFSVKNSLFLNSELLTIMSRHVSISRIVPAKDDLKLILIENLSEQIEPALQTLIDNVIASSQLIKLIFVTPQNIDMQLDCSTYCLEKVIPVFEQSFLFQDLSSDQQNIVLDSEICFQGQNMPVRHLVSHKDLQSDAIDHSVLISLLSQTSKITFGSDVPTLSDFDKSYYIHRHFYKIVLKYPRQLLPALKGERSVLVISYDGIKAKNEIEDFVLSKKDTNVSIYHWQGNFEGYTPAKHKVILVEYRVIPANYNTFWPYFRKLDLCGYWLIYDTKWYWQATFGKRTGQRLEIEYAEEYDELEMFELHRPLVIISDEPGMGKSTLLKYFAQQCKAKGQEAGKTCWVIFVNLENSKHLLSTLKTINISTVMDFLSTFDSSSLSSIGTSLLSYLLQQDGRVTIFFDGLDEVTIDNQSKVFTIANVLLTHTSAKVYIASRLHLRSSLETYFNNYINKFLPLAEPERIEFLAKFWTNHPDFSKYEKTQISIDIVKSYALHLLNELQVSLNIMQADSFIGVPLQLFMLGNISLPQVIAFYSQVHETSLIIDSNTLQEHTVIFGNIFNLYQMFVGEKCRISLEEKCRLTQLSEHYPWHNEILTGALIELHRKSSFFLLFPIESEVFTSGNILESEEIQVLLRVGIVHSSQIDINSLQFIHRSLAEYFAADFLVNRLTMPHLKGRAIDFLKKNIFLPNFDKIRFFIDHFISIQPTCNSIFRKCLDWHKEKVNILETLENTSENTEILDLLGRNVLHYAIFYGDHNYGILWILIQNSHLFYKTDVFGCCFLSYTALLPNFIELQFMHPWVSMRNFLHCFHSTLLEKVEEMQDLEWILWFSGQRVNKLNKMWSDKKHNICVASTRSEFEDEINRDITFFGRAKQIEKFSQIIKTGPSKLPTDLIVAAMRGDSEPKRPSTVLMFLDIMMGYLDSSEKYLQPFEIAMTIGGEPHIKVALQLYERVRYKQYIKVAAQMLDIMARDNFSLFKNSIEFLSKDKKTNDLSSDPHTVAYLTFIEIHLWLHCKKQRKEMFRIIANTKFVTFRRVLKVLDSRLSGRFINEFLKIYQQLKDEKIRAEIIEILREDDDLAFKTAFECKVSSSSSIWKFLPTVEVKEEVLAKHYDTLKKHVIEKIRTNFDQSSQFNLKILSKFLITIYESVGGDWRSRIKEDVQMNWNKLRLKALSPF